MNKLVEIAYKKHRACRGSNASRKSSGNRISKQAALAFAKRTLARCRKFEETGTSCFSEHLFEETGTSCFSEHLFKDDRSASMCTSDAKCADNIKEGQNLKPQPDAFAGQSKSKATGILASRLTIDPAAQRGPHGNGLDKDFSGAFQPLAHASELSSVNGESWSTRRKRRELSLHDVVNNLVRGASGSSPLGETERKLTERDTDHNREAMMKTPARKAGRPAVGTIRGKCKTKRKPRQLTTSVNGLVGRAATDTPDSVLSLMKESSQTVKEGGAKAKVLSNGWLIAQDPLDTEAPIDLIHLPLPGMDDLGVSDDLVGQGQDLGTWLALPDDGMQDHDVDFDGLLIPMDDLADVIKRN